MEEEKIDTVTLDSVLSDEPVVETVEAEAPQEAEAETKEERARDEKGRFVAKEAPTEPEVVETPKEEKPDHIPSWRLREEAENRREAERRAAQLESMIAQYEQRLKAMEPKPEPQKFPDIFAEPESLQTYLQQMIEGERSKMQQEFKAAVANMSLQRAHDKYGDQFMEAYQEIISRPIDDPVRQQVINSPDPGNTLVNLYQREKTIQEVGTDPAAYREKLKAELLADQAFLAEALQAAKGVASAQPTQKINLPPSLNKATAARNSDDGDMSGGSLYSYSVR